MRIIVPLLTVAASVYGTYHLMGTITPDSLASPSDRTSTGVSGVSGGDAHSLLRAADFAKALTTLAQRSANGRSASIRLAADRLDTQVPAGRGSTILQIDGDAKVTFRVDATTPSSSELRIAAVDTTAPERIVRAIAERQPGTGLDDVDYMVLGGGTLPGWSVFLTSGKQRFFRALPDGRRVTVPGEPVPASPGTASRAAPEVRVNGRTPAQITRCIQRAGGDVEKMSACVQ
jgi:hypothetical protein